MAYKDPFKKNTVGTLDKPYGEPYYQSKQPPVQNQTGGGYVYPATAAPTTQQQPASTDPGYVAPNRTLTMPEYSAYDVAAPDPYNSRWQAQIDSLMGDIMNRKPFQYDLNSDALYNQAAQRYIQQGQMAMMDTMGQAAALTGGYGNSYAQQAGQQAYQGYLQGLNDNIAQYYQLAYDRYNQEGNQMRQNLSMLNQAEDSDYGRYQDKYNQWYNERAYADNRSDTQWERDYQYQKDQMSIQDDNYNRLAGLISNYGYQATDEELAAAGMSRSIADTMRNAWVSAQAPKGGSGRSGPNQGTDSSPTIMQAALMAAQASKQGVAENIIKKGLYAAGLNKNQVESAVSHSKKISINEGGKFASRAPR